MKAILKNYHQSPRKVGLVARLIRGKSVPAARAALMYLPKKSSPAISKLLDSAVANARQGGQSAENLFVKTITVNKGLVMRRSRPFARGRAGTVRKTMSIIFLELAATNVGTSKKSDRKTRAPKTSKKLTSKN
jgi:large subunit ribosomal protein L22